MNYSLLILSPPNISRTSTCAAEFAQHVIERGHVLHRVFFLDAGAATGSSTAVFAQDEADPIDQWAKLSTEHNIELVVCITSALRQGVLDDAEATRHERGSTTLHKAFTIGGLGLLIDACQQSDRLITFGG